MPNITIVVAVYNASNHIPLFFDRIDHAHHPFDWIFVDDGSTDGSSDLLIEATQYHPNMKVIAKTTNDGPFQARLNGVRNCRTQFWTYLDIDDTIDLKALQDFTEKFVPDIMPIFKLKYTDHSLNVLSKFKFMKSEKAPDYLENYPKWRYPACGLYEVKLYLDELGHLENMPFNFDEYAFRHYHTIQTKPVTEVNVSYYYVIQGTSLSRTFSKKRLSYYSSPNILKESLSKQRYKITKISTAWCYTNLIKNDIRQIANSRYNLTQKLISGCKVILVALKELCK